MRTQGQSVLRLSVCLAIAALTLSAPGVQGRLETKLVRRDGGHMPQPHLIAGAHLQRRQGIQVGGNDLGGDSSRQAGDSNSDDDSTTSTTTSSTNDAQDSPSADDARTTTSTTQSPSPGGDQESTTSTTQTTSSEDDSTAVNSPTTSSSPETSQDQPESTATSTRTTPDDDASSTSPDSQSVAVKPSTISNSDGVSVIDLTSTIEPSSKASSSASKKADSSDDDSGGLSLGKKALIIIISVASAVALVAAIWTILRKWKFSPSKRFERRLNPIDWQAAPDDQVHFNQHDAGSLNRADSFNSNSGSSLRGGTGGSAVGGPMSERSDAYSHITGGYARQAPSNVGSAYNAAPAYPPGFNPAAYSSSSYSISDYQQRSYSPAPQLNNPYDAVTRQNTVMSTSTHGGRYGEGYGPRTHY